MWTQQEAIWMLASLEPRLKEVGCHCGLTGSVLYRGDSKKDLDVIIYPHWKKDAEPQDLQPVKAWLVKFFESDKMNDCASTSQERDDKHVCWLLTKAGKRIDFFFLQ
jgi:hypothetical protein